MRVARRRDDRAAPRARRGRDRASCASAAEATAAAHLAGMKATRAGIRECDVRAAMEAAIVARGMTVAYDPIVTVHGEVLHNHSHHHTLGERRSAARGRRRGDAGRLGRRRHAHLAGGGQVLGDAAGDLRGRARRAARHASRRCGRACAIASCTCSRRARSRRGSSTLGILRGDPEELVADGVIALFFPHGVGHLHRPRRARHGGPRRSRGLRAGPHAREASSGSRTCGSIAISRRAWR